MAFNLFPYSNSHKLNLDWVIKEIKEAKKAMELAATTVQTFGSRMDELESSMDSLEASVALLRTSITVLGARVDRVQADLASHLSRIEAAEDAAEQASTDAAAATSAANAATSAAAAATGAAQTASAQAQSASAEASRLDAEKLDIVGADAEEILGVTGNNLSDPWPFYIKRTGVDPADYEIVRANVVSRNILVLDSESKSGASVVSAAPVIRGVGTPLEVTDAANKAYVDGLTSQIVGSTVSITPADNTIYQCRVLSQLTIADPPANGRYTIVFTSGETPTTTVFPASILGLETFVAEPTTVYEINVWDNRAVIGSWAVTA